MLRKKGFIGPIGDDIPTMLVVILGLGMFFSSVVFAMDLYGQKNRNIEISEGALAISRVFTAKGHFDPQDDGMKERGDLMARSYGLHYQVLTDGYDFHQYPPNSGVCQGGSYRYSFFIANFENENNVGSIDVCVRG